MNNGVAIPLAQVVLVTASSDRSLDAQATGGSAGLIVAGAAVAIADARGATLADIGSGAKIGQTGTVGSVDVAASSIDSATANAMQSRPASAPSRSTWPMPKLRPRSRPRSARAHRFWSDKTSRSLPGPSRRPMPTFPASRARG